MIVVVIVGVIGLGVRSCFFSASEELVALHPPVYSSMHWKTYVVTQVPVSLAPIYRANAEEVLKASDDLRHVPRYATYPRGAIIRKENRGKDGKLISVSEMIREHNDAVAGRDPWWYRQYDAHGTLQYEGNAADARVQQECAACHRGAADRDFLFHSYLTAQAE